MRLCVIIGLASRLWSKRLAHLECGRLETGGAAQAEGGHRVGRKSEFWSRRRKRVDGQAERVNVTMSQAERAQLHMLEQQTKFSPSRILVSATLHGVSFSSEGIGESAEERHTRIAELLHLRRVVGGIANNINQIARHANTTGEFPDDLDEHLRQCREVYDLLTEVAKQNRLT